MKFKLINIILTWVAIRVKKKLENSTFKYETKYIEIVNFRY